MTTTNDIPGRLTPEEIDGSLAIVQDVFKQFRSVVLERAGKSAHTDKQDGSPVTDTDVEIEKALQIALRERFPKMLVLGEETGYNENLLPPTCWLVDPIDGTKSFIEGMPSFTSMAVLIQDGEATACVIYNPSTGDMYVARKGKGAYRNGTRLDLTTVPLSHMAYCKGRFVDALNDILEPHGVLCQNGPTGAGFGFSSVADGVAAARFNLLSKGHIHDYAPGALLVREAGGAIIPVLDDEYTYETRSFVACHPALESTIRAHVQTLRDLETNLADPK